jgi:hypothetical protein
VVRPWFLPNVKGLKMAVNRTFPRGTFKVEPGPGEREVSVIFKPTQSTIVFTIITDGSGKVAPAQDCHIHHTRPGGFGRFSETEVVEEARKLVLPFAKKAGPR